MRLAEGIDAIELGGLFAGQAVTVWPVLFNDPDGATLVDTGYPGLVGTLLAALESLSAPPSRLRRIILTHQDFDHIGSASELVGRSGARVLAHPADIPFIQGDRPLIKLNAERFRERLAGASEAARRQVEAVLASPPRVAVDEALADGQVLPIHGGVRVIHTPGHTPGHVSLYVPGERLLMAADELRVVDGELLGPNPPATPDMGTALAYLKRLAELDVERVLCYHGGLWGPRAGERIRELAEGA